MAHLAAKEAGKCSPYLVKTNYKLGSSTGEKANGDWRATAASAIRGP